MPIKHSGLDRFIVVLNAIFLTLAVLIIVLPLIYVVIASFMDPSVLLSKGLSFNLSDWSLEGYIKILSNPAMIRGFGNSVLYSVSLLCLPFSSQSVQGTHCLMTGSKEKDSS